MSSKKKTGIATDSNSGFTRETGRALGIHVVPMPFSIDNETYFEGVNLTQEQFYERMAADADIHTSMPLMEDVMQTWETALEEYEEIVYLPMSGGLSSGYAAAVSMAEEYEGRVHVVDSCRVSVPQKRLVLAGAALANAGMSASQTAKILSETAMDSVVFIAVDTLKYLKKGGRVTGAVAAVGNLLKVKPVLRMQGDKLDMYKIARTMKHAKSIMVEAIEKEISETFHTTMDEMNLEVAYSSLSPREAELMRDELAQHFGREDILVDPLTLSLACHIGPDGLGIACTKKVPGEN